MNTENHEYQAVVDAARDVCRAVLTHELSSVTRRTWPAVSESNHRLWHALKAVGLDPLDAR